MDHAHVMAAARKGWMGLVLCAVVACGDSSSDDPAVTDDTGLLPSDAGGDTSGGGDATTPEGFAMLEDIDPSGSSGPNNFVVAGSHTFFVANDGTHGRELWVTDGTTAGTHLVKEIVPGAAGPDFRFAKLAVIGEKILFVATGGAAIGPLWVSDGTEAGTQQLKDKGVVEFYAATPSHVFFTLDDPATGAELWTTDGTSAGTHIVLDANAGSGSSEIRVATVFGERLAFHAFHKDPVGGQSDYVYVTSGAAGDAVPVTPSSGKGASPFFVNGVAFGDRALFTFATEAEGEELWLTDGTSSGTRMVKDTWPGTTPGYPSAMTVVGTKAFFFAYDGSNDSKFLWETDGTTGGTKIVAQVGLAANHVRMTPKGGKLYFSGRQAKAGSPPDAAFDGLWETDGTTAGTRLISNAVLPTPWSVPGPGQEPNFTMVVVGDKLVFFGSSPDGGTEPWVSDGTSAGTMRLQDVYPGKPGCTNPSSGLVTLGTKAYFVPVVATSDYRLFETDGTTAGTHAIAPPGASADSKNTVFEEPVRMGTILLFGGAFDARGAELYKL